MYLTIIKTDTHMWFPICFP